MLLVRPKHAARKHTERSPLKILWYPTGRLRAPPKTLRLTPKTLQVPLQHNVGIPNVAVHHRRCVPFKIGYGYQIIAGIPLSTLRAVFKYPTDTPTHCGYPLNILRVALKHPAFTTKHATGTLPTRCGHSKTHYGHPSNTVRYSQKTL